MHVGRVSALQRSGKSADCHMHDNHPRFKMASCKEHNLFKTMRVVQHMILPPSYLGRIGVGVIENLNRRILKFSSEHQGFILAYSKPLVLQRAAIIQDELSGLHFDVQVDLYLFAPKVGSVLQGTVNHIQNNTHVGCLVYGCFNATVLRTSKGSHRRKNGIERGQSIVFKVVSLEKVSGVLCIQGKEVKPQSGAYYSEEGSAADVSVSEQQGSRDISEGDSSKKKKSKKKKKLRDSLNDTSISSSVSALDVSHCTETVAQASGHAESSQRKRREIDRDKAGTDGTSGPTSSSKAKRRRHQDGEGNKTLVKEEFKSEGGPLTPSHVLEASGAVERNSKSDRKKDSEKKHKHKRKHTHRHE